MTGQRRLVLEFMQSQSGKHPSAEDVYEALRASHPALSLATVYRNLSVLAEQGKIRECDFGTGAAQYDARLDLHGHFVCESCASVSDFTLPEKICPAHFGAYQQGIVMRGKIDFYGLCTACVAVSAVKEAKK